MPLIFAKTFQYLGFGIGGQSAGRRAASQADVAHQTACTDAEEDNQEKDALLSQVEARDLIEFGMIPVSGNDTNSHAWSAGG